MALTKEQIGGPLCTFDQDVVVEPFTYSVAWPPSTLPATLGSGTLFNTVFNAASKAPNDLVKELLDKTRNSAHTVALNVEGTNSDSFTDIEIYARVVNSIYGTQDFSLDNVFKIGERGAITDGNISITGGAGTFANLGSSSNVERSSRVEIYGVPFKSGESSLTNGIFGRSRELIASYASDEGAPRGFGWGNEMLTGGIPTHLQNAQKFPLPQGKTLYGLDRALRVPHTIQVQSGQSASAQFFYIWLPERLKSISRDYNTGLLSTPMWSSTATGDQFFTETEIAASAATGWAKRWVYKTRLPQRSNFVGVHLSLEGLFNV